MLVERHQLLQAYLSASSRFHGDGTVLDTVVAVESHIPEEVRKLMVEKQIHIHHMFSEHTYKGTNYKTGQVLPLDVEHASQCILLGEIVFIAMSEGGLHCIVNKKN
jgi:hypothetical protein